MKECADANQIRQYGIKKVDKRLIENIEAEKKKKNSKSGKIQSKQESTAEQIIKLKVQIKKKSKDLEIAKPADKSSLKKEVATLEKQLEKLKSEYKILTKAKSKSKQSRSKSRTKTKSVKPKSIKKVKK